MYNFSNDMYNSLVRLEFLINLHAFHPQAGRSTTTNEVMKPRLIQILRDIPSKAAKTAVSGTTPCPVTRPVLVGQTSYRKQHNLHTGLQLSATVVQQSVYSIDGGVESHVSCSSCWARCDRINFSPCRVVYHYGYFRFHPDIIYIYIYIYIYGWPFGLF